MSDKQPIPIPAEQKLQDFRQIVLPVIVFLLCITGVMLLWWNKVSPSSVVGEARSENIILSSPRAGLLTKVNVGRFDSVKEGPGDITYMDVVATKIPLEHDNSAIIDCPVDEVVD